MIRAPDLTVLIMALAARIAPVTDKEWLRAMEAEVDHAHQTGDGIAFAMGCLRSAAFRRAASPTFLATATQTSVSLGLMTMGAIGVWLSGRLAEELPSGVLLTASIIYATGGVLAILSVRALRVFSCVGAAAAALLASWFAFGWGLDLPRDYFLAVVLEALTVFAGLVVASVAVLRWRLAQGGG